jgi:hypothetical protein
MKAIQAKFKSAMKDVPQSEWNTPENTAKWQKMYKEMQDSPVYQRDRQECERLQHELLPFVTPAEKGQGLPDDPAACHGYVWLFRRK